MTRKQFIEKYGAEIAEWASLAVPRLAGKLAPIYRLLEWEWVSTEGPPDSKQISAALFDKLHYLLTHPKDLNISSGGLTARLQEDAEGMWELRLSFNIDEACSVKVNRPLAGAAAL